MVYVLDSNVMIHYLQKNASVKKNFFQAVADGNRLLIPRAADYEICRGLELLSATAKAKIYKEITGSTGQCEIVDMGECVWEIAKQIYADLHRKDFTVGEIDILLGAFCLHHDYTLVTSNTKHFIHMNGLRLENWWAE